MPPPSRLPTWLNALLLTLILLLTALGLYWGWRVFWFLTDDAYIAFRYVSNSQLGYGYVWNAPPFRPVEGYTSFLWVVLLDGVWRITGVEPPAAANTLALICAYGTTLIGVGMLLKMRLRPTLEPYRLAFLALALLSILTNRTYLAWTSSGLETALFNCLLTAWVAVGCLGNFSQLRTQLALASFAALLALTRPDGLLFVAATAALHAFAFIQHRRARWLWPFALYGLNLAHLLWRRAFYGEWLPNTYAAKYVSPWFESGWRYALTFIIEYGLWLWLALALVGGLMLISREVARFRSLPPMEWLTQALPPSVVLGTLVAHFAYYTFIIGGDHFEYRIYSHLPLLLAIAFVWLLNALNLKPTWALALSIIFVVGTWPVQWTHWALGTQTQGLVFRLKVPIAPAWPAFARPYAQWYDSLEDWLIEHGVGIRYPEHKNFAERQPTTLPTRAEGLLLAPTAQAIRIDGTVGLVGWLLPTANVIDWLGLNDYVIARHPLGENQERYMAHERRPPAGYTECFQANFQADFHRFIVAQRAPGDFATVVTDCEQRAWPVTPFDPNRSAPNLALAPAAQPHINHLWGPDPLYLHYVPPEQTPPQTIAEVVQVFEQPYAGAGCVVLPPENPATGYWFALLAPNPRPPLPTVQTLFPWTHIVTETHLATPPPYQLGYLAPLQNAQPNLQPATPYVVEWEVARLQGFTLADAKAGASLYLTLYFQVKQTPTGYYGAAIQVTDPAQPAAPLAQFFGDACSSVWPTPLWTPGTTLISHIPVPLPAETPAGAYVLNLNLFDWQTGATLSPILPAADLPLVHIR